MHNLRRNFLNQVRTLLDLSVMAACFALVAIESCRLSGAMSSCSILSARISVRDFLAYAVYLLLWRAIFFLFGLNVSERISSFRREAVDVVKATFAGSLALFALDLVFRTSSITIEFIALFWIATALGTITTRLLLRNLQQAMRRRGLNLRHVLIVGTNSKAIKFSKKIESKSEAGYKIVGFVENGCYGNGEFKKSGYKVVTDFESFPDFISSNVVEEVMVCLPLKSHYDQCYRIAKSCEEQGIVVRFMSELFDLPLAVPNLEALDGVPVLTLRTGAMQGWPLLMKRGIDIVLSAVMLLSCWPLFVPIAILIKLTSSGPVFFTQMRPGLHKRPFKIYKFRTMVKDADNRIGQVAHMNEENGPAFKIKNDPRITSFGRFLRRTSLDELPQLINVLKGEMSLVGPRPLFYWEFDRIEDAWVRRRNSVRPGVTGLWQVSGRSDVSFDGRVRMDLEYVDTWSLAKDFRILAKTALVVLTGKGAV
ncbi:MAG: sugar transferase [Syntrophobacteraceae bacterium]|nr:sugar transferase [Syntrophobacteraceae bacterium]